MFRILPSFPPKCAELCKSRRLPAPEFSNEMWAETGWSVLCLCFSESKRCQVITLLILIHISLASLLTSLPSFDHQTISSSIQSICLYTSTKTSNHFFPELPNQRGEESSHQHAYTRPKQFVSHNFTPQHKTFPILRFPQFDSTPSCGKHGRSRIDQQPRKQTLQSGS